MANYAGDLGSVTYATSTDTAIEVLSWSWSGANVGTIEDTAKGDANRTYKGGRADGGSVSVRCQLDYGDSVQAAWISSVIAGTGSAVAVELVVGSSKQFNVNVIPTGIELESPEGEGITSATLSGKVTGVPVVSWS
jgi:hypothetical protein